MAALAPIVEGPLVAGMTEAQVSGALAGAEVELLVNGAPAGSKPAAANGSLWVPLKAALVAGQSVTAVQRMGGVDSPPSNYPVPVVPAPTPLPLVVFLSPMSQFMSHVLLGGL